MTKRWTESDWYVPSDWIALLGFLGAPIVAIWVGGLLPWLSTARQGNPTPFYASLVLASVGIILLFFARLPLYREHKFFTFGSRQLTGIYKTLYRIVSGQSKCTTLEAVMLG